MCEDKLLELLVTYRMANTGNIGDLLGMAINADTLYQAILTTLRKHSKPEWEYHLAQTFYLLANVGDQMVANHTLVGTGRGCFLV